MPSVTPPTHRSLATYEQLSQRKIWSRPTLADRTFPDCRRPVVDIPRLAPAGDDRPRCSQPTRPATGLMAESAAWAKDGSPALMPGRSVLKKSGARLAFGTDFPVGIAQSLSPASFPRRSAARIHERSQPRWRMQIPQGTGDTWPGASCLYTRRGLRRICRRQDGRARTWQMGRLHHRRSRSDRRSSTHESLARTRGSARPGLLGKKGLGPSRLALQRLSAGNEHRRGEHLRQLLRIFAGRIPEVERHPGPAAAFEEPSDRRVAVGPVSCKHLHDIRLS